MRASSRVAIAFTVLVVALPSLAEATPPPVTPEAPVVPSQPHATDRVLVSFRSGVSAVARVRSLSADRSRRHRRVSSTRPGVAATELVELPSGVSVQDALRVFGADPNVAYVEPDFVVQSTSASDDPIYTAGNLWGMQGDASSPANTFGTGAAEAWAAGYTGSTDVVVGIVDEGVQFDHPDLAANIWTNPGETVDGLDNDGNGYIDDIHGWDFYDDDNSVFDGSADPSIDAHGTHVAGTIGGVGGNGQGVAGVNWHVTMVSTKFMGPDGGYTSDAIRALDYLTDLKLNRGVNVVASSNSWGGGGYSKALEDAINRGGDAGILFVAAAGNSSTNNDQTASYPSNHECTKGGTRGWDCVVAVAAIDRYGALASFSQYGAATVDLGAPGVTVASTVPNGSYAYYSGTSMATPHVTGAIALCKSINPALSAAEVRAAIMNSVAPTSSLAGKTVTGGRLDLGAMVGLCLPPQTETPVTGVVSDLAAVALDETSVQLNWTDTISDETSLDVQKASSSGGVCGTFTGAGAAPLGATSFTVGSLAAGTDWCFRIRGASTAGLGSTTEWSNVATAHTVDPLPPAPYSCARAAFGWVDTSAGTSYLLGDDGSASVVLPFTVGFYGKNFTSLTISANGFVRLGAGVASAYSNTALPNPADPNNLIAAWWDDLDPSLGGSVRSITIGSSPNRRFVVSWNGVPHHSGAATTVSVQLVLDESTNLVTLNYLDTVTGDATSSQGIGATVGMENSTGTVGTSISVNTAGLLSGTSFRCSNTATLQAPTISTTAFGSGNVARGYALQLAAGGGAAPLSWSLVGGSLPPGLFLTSSGVITGTPTTMGTWWSVVQVTDATGLIDSRTLPLTVLAKLPAGFNKSAPSNGRTGRSRTAVTLSWGAAKGATSYQYCVDTINDNQCNGTWVTTKSRSATIRRLGSLTTYYWQVRAVNAGGNIGANGGFWFRFTTRR